MGNFIAIVFGGAFIGYIFSMIAFAVVMLFVLIIAEIKYPNTTRYSSTPTKMGLHYVTRAGKEKEASKKEAFVQSFFDPLFKTFSIAGVLVGIVVMFYQIH